MARIWDDLDARALDWVIRTRAPDFDDWDGFTLWLEAAPEHAERYHAIAADSADMAEALPPAPLPPLTSAPSRTGWATRRGWIGGALAACLLLAVGIGAWERRAQPYVVQTAAGETRLIALPDGSRIAMNGASRIALDRRDPRVATLEAGQALFTIRHDDDAPFVLSLGDAKLVDLGTQFDVTRGPDDLRIAVSEGAAEYRLGTRAIRLPAGRGMDMHGTDIATRTVDTAGVGGWTRGQLDYAGAPLEQVAGDLSRSLGIAIRVAPAIARQPFRGTIALAGLKRYPAQAGPLLGVTMRRTADGWEMQPTP